MPRNDFKPWDLLIRYDWWAETIYTWWGSRYLWSYDHIFELSDQFREDMQEALRLYCMGDEL